MHKDTHLPVCRYMHALHINMGMTTKEADTVAFLYYLLLGDTHYDCFNFLNPWQNIKAFSDFPTCPLQEPVPCRQPGLYLQTYFSLWNLVALPCSSHLRHLLSPPQVKVTIRHTVSFKPKVSLWTPSLSEPLLPSCGLFFKSEMDVIWLMEVYPLRRKSWCLVGPELIWWGSTYIKRER